jgi:hypothetical protein
MYDDLDERVCDYFQCILEDNHLFLPQAMIEAAFDSIHELLYSDPEACFALDNASNQYLRNQQR